MSMYDVESTTDSQFLLHLLTQIKFTYIEETPDTKTFLIDYPEGYTWEEGAHIHLGLEGFNAGEKPNKGLVRHMSLSTLPGEGPIGITTRIREKRSEYKELLNSLKTGDSVAIFKTHSNVPLRREDKTLYLLSSGVGLATFRPLVLDYLNNADKIKNIHSLNVDSSSHFLFPKVFVPNEDKGLTIQFVNSRTEYYEEVKNLAQDKEGIFYVIGSDDFLHENISILHEQGIKTEQIMLDKRAGQMEKFFI